RRCARVCVCRSTPGRDGISVQRALRRSRPGALLHTHTARTTGWWPAATIVAGFSMGRRMFLRLLLLLLLARSYCVGGCLLSGRKQPPLPPPTDPGVAELQLLSDQPPAADAPRPGDPAARASGTCMRIGPFDTRSGMNQAFQALMPAVPRIQ